MSENAIEQVSGKRATISFNGRLCIHSRRCVISQPGVFKANVEGAWIDPDAASAEDLIFVALNCPSGAIQVTRHDGGAQESAPQKLLEEGQKRFHANCGRCHQSPHKFPPRMVMTIERHMRVRATLTDEDMRTIVAYLTQ